MKHTNKLVIVVILIVASLVATGCGQGNEAREKSAAKKQEAFDQQSAAVPYPAEQLKDSLERRNLAKKLLRDNKKDAIRYVYVLSFAKPLGYYTIRGKVSSTQSQMNQSDEIYRKCDGVSAGCTEWFTVEAPGDDGSFGPNEQGIFFFTTEDVMVTTSLDYIVSDQPIPFGGEFGEDLPLLNPDKK